MHYVDAMCALNICSSLALFPPSMWPTLVLNFKLLSSWREKRPSKACEKNALWIYFSTTEFYVTFEPIRISYFSNVPGAFSRGFHPSRSFPLASVFLSWPRLLRLSPLRKQMLRLCPDVLSLLLSNHVFPKFSYSKHLQRCLLSTAATDMPRG